MTRRSQELPGSAARPSPDGVETDRRGDETLLHDRRAPDARDADWMLSRTRSSSACLGDGSIARHPRAYKLRVVQDARYPNSIEEIRRAMATVRHCELDRIRTVQHVGCVEVYTYWKHWPCVFPQHGPGMKHQRRIELAAWQASIIAEQPTSLLRGLIHSDGCRVINRVGKGKYAYPRYLFSNRSEDIRRIFREACDSVGVRPTNPKPDEISVARRADVVALDSFVGPKT
jgi:hypothetical protein